MADTLSHGLPHGLDRFYPIVPDLAWLDRLLSCGIRLVQLRLKDASPAEVDRQVGLAVDRAARAGCTLVVNDHWQAAIDHGAPWLHLGQEDLAGADLPAIRRAGLRLGLSTHDEAELDTALAQDPGYVALGPVYHTTLKAMRWSPQGLGRLAEWKARVAVPLVGIGGITLERAPGVFAAGADIVSVVSDVTGHADPEGRTAAWLAARDGWSRP